MRPFRRSVHHALQLPVRRSIGRFCSIQELETGGDWHAACFEIARAAPSQSRRSRGFPRANDPADRFASVNSREGPGVPDQIHGNPVVAFTGTGFTAIPFIASCSTTHFGNTTLWIRGLRAQDGTVPALPLFGIAVPGASLVAGGVTAISRRRRS